MPEYGVWLEEEGDDPPRPSFVWRGVANDEHDALRAAAQAWEDRDGPRPDDPEDILLQIIEVTPADAGYRGQ